MGRKNRNLKKRLRKEREKKRKRTKGSRTKIEAKVAQFLNDMGIKYRQNESVGRFNVDFLIGEKYIIEAYGDYWHCNPQKYPPDYYNRGLKYEAHERWTKDQNRRRELEAMGYAFLILWESEINSAPKLCKINMKQLLNGNYKSTP